MKPKSIATYCFRVARLVLHPRFSQTVSPIGIGARSSRLSFALGCLCAVSFPALFALFPTGEGRAAVEHRSALGGALEQPRAGALVAGPTPDRSLSAAEVVRIQVESLQQNGLADGGIQTTYRFASQSNKRITGPYERFAEMIKSPPYRTMLNARAIVYGDLRVSETEAVQEVRVSGTDGQNVTFVFALQRQSDSPYAGCWMTEAVVVAPDEEQTDFKPGPPGTG